MSLQHCSIFPVDVH